MFNNDITAAKEPPKDKDPVSPMKISLVVQNSKKTWQAPTMEPQK